MRGANGAALGVRELVLEGRGGEFEASGEGREVSEELEGRDVFERRLVRSSEGF